MESIQWKFYFVYIVILIIEVTCIWYIFVETKGLTLEEVGRLLDIPRGGFPTDDLNLQQTVWTGEAKSADVEYTENRASV